MAQRENLLLANMAKLASATVTASSYAPLGPPSNLQRNKPSYPLIWDDLSDTWLRAAWTAPVAARLFWLGYLGCTDAATWRLQLRLGGVDVYDSRQGGIDLACVPEGEGIALEHRKLRRHCYLLLEDAVEFDEAVITVFDPDNPAGRLILGSLVIDQPYQPERNASYGLTPPSMADPSRVGTAAPGQRDPLNRAPYDISAFELRFGSEDEVIGAWRDFIEQVGTTEPVLVLFKPQATKYRERWTSFGLLEVAPPSVLRSFRLFALSIRIEELIP